MKKNISIVLIFVSIIFTLSAKNITGIGVGMIIGTENYIIDDGKDSATESYTATAVSIDILSRLDSKITLFADTSIGFVTQYERAIALNNVEEYSEEFDLSGLDTKLVMNSLIGLGSTLKMTRAEVFIGGGFHMYTLLFKTNDDLIAIMNLGAGALVNLSVPAGAASLNIGLQVGYDFYPLLNEYNDALVENFPDWASFNAITISPSIGFLF